MTLRDKTLYLLEKNRGSFVSGQEIAEAAGVSRSAVAKCVALLKNEGYPIESVNNSGHCLSQSCDILSEAGIRARLWGDTVIKVYKSIDSTNSQAKREIAQGLEDDAIFASEEQTAGRGRRGKSFYSPRKSGLYFSAVLHPKTGLADSTAMTAAAAVAVTEVIAEVTKKDPKIKWVNDIYIDGKKVCGILTEAVSDFESDAVQAVIVGIGINITTEDFPEDISGIAASLDEDLNRCELIAKIFMRLKELSEKLTERSFMDDYRKHSMVLGKEITFTKNDILYKATATEILDDGGLSVITEEGEAMVLNSGEISIRPAKS